MKKDFYFQFLDSQKLGKVVKLDHIVHEKSIINPDPMFDDIYFIFSDKSKCNINVISEMNDYSAYSSGKYYMARILNEQNIWQFDKKEPVTFEHRELINKEGEVVSTLDPDEDFIRKHNNSNNKKIIAIPPKLVINKNNLVEIQKAKQILGAKFNSSINVSNINLFQDKGYDNVLQAPNNDFLDKNAISTGSPEDIKKFENSNTILPDGLILIEREILKNAEIENYLKNADNDETEIKTVSDVNNPEETTLNENKTASPEPSEKSTVHQDNDVPEEDKFSLPVNNDSPIIGIISKCKKVEIDAPLILNLNIPSKSIYNFVKENFDEKYIDDFFNIIINDISIDEIKKALRKALENSYESAE